MPKTKQQEAQEKLEKVLLVLGEIGIRDFTCQVTHGLSPYYLSLSRGKCSLLVYEALDCRSSGVSVEDGADAAGGFAKRKEIKFR